MSVTLTFKEMREERPKHDEDIIWLRSISAYDSEGFEPRQVRVEYCWFEVDEDGYPTGNQACYDADYEDDEDLVNWKLEIILDGWMVTDDDLWMSVDDYWKAFERK